MTKITLCMIVKDEGNNLKRCLGSIRAFVDEIVLIDTGSKDNSKEIAKKFNCKIIDYKWENDFSKARNESLEHANGEWILVLDADEFLDEKNKERIKELIAKDNDAYILVQKNYTTNNKISGFVSDPGSKYGINYQGWYASLIVRLFKKDKFRFKGTVHEVLEPIEGKPKISPSDIVIHHFGNVDPKVIEKKRKSYLDLCKNKVKEDPSSNSYFQLGVLYKENAMVDEAIEALKKSAELDTKNFMPLFELGTIFQNEGEFDEAIEFFEKSLKIKESSTAYHSLGVCYMKKGNLKQAHKAVGKALLLNPKNYTFYNTFAAILEKLGNFKDAISALTIGIGLNPNNPTAYYNMGVIYDKMNDTENAIKNYQKAAKLNHKDKEKILQRIDTLDKANPSNSSFTFSFGLGE